MSVVTQLYLYMHGWVVYFLFKEKKPKYISQAFLYFACNQKNCVKLPIKPPQLTDIANISLWEKCLAAEVERSQVKYKYLTFILKCSTCSRCTDVMGRWGREAEIHTHVTAALFPARMLMSYWGPGNSSRVTALSSKALGSRPLRADKVRVFQEKETLLLLLELMLELLGDTLTA